MQSPSCGRYGQCIGENDLRLCFSLASGSSVFQNSILMASECTLLLEARLHSWQKALHFFAVYLERSPFSGFCSIRVKTCVLCVERSPLSGFCSHHFLEENDGGMTRSYFGPSGLPVGSDRLDCPPFRVFFLCETRVSFVLDSDAIGSSSSGFEFSPVIFKISDIFLDLLGHLRWTITYKRTPVAIDIYCA